MRASRARGVTVAASRRALLVVVALLAGCMSQETKRDAINDINAAFKAQYEAMLAKNGTRAFGVDADEAFDAECGGSPEPQARPRATLARPRLHQRRSGRAAAAESRRMGSRRRDADLPQAREILGRHVGPLAVLFNFEPEGLDIVITATDHRARGGSEVSLTMRMREVAAPKSEPAATRVSAAVGGAGGPRQDLERRWTASSGESCDGRLSALPAVVTAGVAGFPGAVRLA